MKKKLAGSASLSLDQIPLTAESLQLYRHINHQFKQNQTEEGGIETYGSWALPPYVYNPNEKVMTYDEFSSIVRQNKGNTSLDMYNLISKCTRIHDPLYPHAPTFVAWIENNTKNQPDSWHYLKIAFDNFHTETTLKSTDQIKNFQTPNSSYYKKHTLCVHNYLFHSINDMLELANDIFKLNTEHKPNYQELKQIILRLNNIIKKLIIKEIHNSFKNYFFIVQKIYEKLKNQFKYPEQHPINTTQYLLMKLNLANTILKIADKYNQVFTQKINEFKMLNNQEPFITTNYQILVNHEHSQQNKTEIVNFSNPKSEELPLAKSAYIYILEPNNEQKQAAFITSPDKQDKHKGYVNKSLWLSIHPNGNTGELIGLQSQFSSGSVMIEKYLKPLSTFCRKTPIFIHDLSEIKIGSLAVSLKLITILTEGKTYYEKKLGATAFPDCKNWLLNKSFKKNNSYSHDINIYNKACDVLPKLKLKNLINLLEKYNVNIKKLRSKIETITDDDNFTISEVMKHIRTSASTTATMIQQSRKFIQILKEICNEFSNICSKKDNLYSPTSPEQEARQEQELRAMNQIHLMFNEIENIRVFYYTAL